MLASLGRTRWSLRSRRRPELRAIAQTGAIRVPQVFASGAAEGAAFLALEWLDIIDGGRDASLGRALAGMHATTSSRFGWHRDNTIGATPQANAWSDDWAAFFRDRRLRPQLELAERNGHRGTLRRDDPKLLDGFGSAFYATYTTAMPLPAGHEIRRTLYNLYHVLNHLNLFGSAYLSRAEIMVAQLLAVR